MFHVQATIRDYNGTADTATIEMVGAGIIDAWHDNIAIDASLNRALLSHGTTVTVATTDPHAICQGTVIGINSSPKQLTSSVLGANRRYQFGRAVIQADAGGNGSVTITWPIAFLNGNNMFVHAAADDGTTLALGTPGAPSVVASISGATPFAYVYLSWHAEGNK
jgi:hypothetical protein